MHPVVGAGSSRGVRRSVVHYAEKFAFEIPHTTLVRIPGADHIPTESAPGRIAHALTDFFTG